MTCATCVFFCPADMYDARLSNGTCHAAPGQLFLIKGKVETHHPECMADDPACGRYTVKNFMGFGSTSKRYLDEVANDND